MSKQFEPIGVHPKSIVVSKDYAKIADMIELTLVQKDRLQEIGKSHHLRFIILHGSFAKGIPQKGSDLDIAVLGEQRLSLAELLQIQGELGEVFGDNHERELDVKSLHGIEPLLKYFVTREGILLFGDPTDFNEFRSYAFRSFEDAKPLFRLEEHLLKKQNKLILEDLKRA